jgi:hypothetical protein
MFQIASCRNTFSATGAPTLRYRARGLAGEQPVLGDRRCPESAHFSLLGNLMIMMAPTPVRPSCARAASGYPGSAAAETGTGTSEDLMTRSQVASLFRVTSAAVASWARRGRLPEVRNEAGRPRYRRADVETLFHSGMRWRAR